MEAGELLEIIFKVIAGLGIFMLGMKYMSDGLQTIAGNRLRAMIGMVTNNRFLALLVGTGVTCLIQSSSVTTVMVVGFVNAGFMTLTQAIGVIMGANIGTTITGWILVLKIGKYGLPILGVFALIYRFTSRERLRFLAMALMGVGMIFFGLETMKDGFKPLKELDDFREAFKLFQADTYFGVLKCALIGCILTFIVQSSSATLAITISLATTGVIPFATAAALILGENIGTTITAYLASIGTTTNAKRSAYAHVIFNLVGVLWVTALFRPFIAVVKALVIGDPDSVNGDNEYPYIIAAIATTHTIFNLVNVLLFLPFTRKLAALLTRIVPDRAYKEAPHLTSLDALKMQTPVIGVEQSRIEILRMADTLRKMLNNVSNILGSDTPDDATVKKVFHEEEVLDIMQKEVTVFLTDMLAGTVTHDVADEARRMLRMADEYESVSDYAQNIVKLHLRLHHANLRLLPHDLKNILALHQDVAEYVEMVIVACERNHRDIVSKAHTRGDGISHIVRDLRNQHLEEVATHRPNPMVTVVYTDMLNAYRRVKDHALNVAEALAGEK